MQSQLDGVELAAVADHEAAAAQALAAALGVRARSGLHDLLGEEAPELLVVATPPRGRSELVEGAGASGRQIIRAVGFGNLRDQGPHLLVRRRLAAANGWS